MADTISNPSLEPLFFSVDPMSLILSQNSDTHQLKLLLDGFCRFERGPRYNEYSRLRESKLRMKRDFNKFLEEEEEEEEEVPKKKQVRFEGNSVISRAEEEDGNFSPEEKDKKKQTRFGFSPMKTPSKAPSSSLAQSVPDFSAVIRKENRRPVNFYTTPPPKSRNGGGLTGSVSSAAAARGSKSASAGEKKSRGMMGLARKSYASVEDIKNISVAAASAINGGGGGRKAAGSGRGRTILGYRQMY